MKILLFSSLNLNLIKLCLFSFIQERWRESALTFCMFGKNRRRKKDWLLMIFKPMTLLHSGRLVLEPLPLVAALVFSFCGTAMCESRQLVIFLASISAVPNVLLAIIYNFSANLWTRLFIMQPTILMVSNKRSFLVKLCCSTSLGSYFYTSAKTVKNATNLGKFVTNSLNNVITRLVSSLPPEHL